MVSVEEQAAHYWMATEINQSRENEKLSNYNTTGMAQQPHPTTRTDSGSAAESTVSG